MIKRIFTIFILTLLVVFISPAYSLDASSKALEKYTKKISNKFTRTYCNTTKFGIFEWMMEKPNDWIGRK